ncbi:hypothetical protein ACLBR5_03280 [Escherichia coli]
MGTEVTPGKGRRGRQRRTTGEDGMATITAFGVRPWMNKVFEMYALRRY